MIVDRDITITNEHLRQALDASDLLLENLSPKLKYHSKAHTFDYVVPETIKLAKLEGLVTSDQFFLGILGSFHDTGFVRTYNLNESIGAEFLEEYMNISELLFSKSHLEIGRKAIKNTDMSNPPQDIYQCILRDADVSYFASDPINFMLRIYDLKKESSHFLESPLHESSKELKSWVASSIGFIESHN